MGLTEEVADYANVEPVYANVQPVYDVSNSEVGENTWQSDDEFFESAMDSRFFDASGMNLSDDETDDEYSNDHSEFDQVVSATNSPLLYEGSGLTVAASSILLQFKMKHKLTQEALGDLLELMKLHCPSPNKCHQSLYLFTKQFRELKLPVALHYFCSSCLWTIEDAD